MKAAIKAWIARHIIADDPYNSLSVLDKRDGVGHCPNGQSI